MSEIKEFEKELKEELDTLKIRYREICAENKLLREILERFLPELREGDSSLVSKLVFK